jgi:hypothetical protein
MNANILYLATRKIAREQQHGPGVVDYHRVMNEEQNFHRGWKLAALFACECISTLLFV